MKITTQPREDHQASLIVEVDLGRLESAKHRAARRISERKSIPGFRPGRAPYDVVMRTLGEAAITEDAVDLLLDEIYPEALKEANLDPSGPGAVEKIDNLDSKPTFSFIVPLVPVVDLGDYRTIQHPFNWVEPGDDKVLEALEELRRMYSKTEEVDRGIGTGDFVMIDLKGNNIKKGAEGDAPLIDRPGFPVFIRPDEIADEWPFAGFSKELLGVKAGENKTFNHKYPKDIADESLSGITVRFNAAVKMVRGAVLPALDDDFARMVGAFENLGALRDVLRANISMQSKSDYENEYFVDLMDKIISTASIKYPPQMINQEIDQVLNDLKSRLADQGLDLAAYFKMQETTQEQFVENEAKPVAIKRLERSLVMQEIMRAENIEVSEDTLAASFKQTWGQFRSSDDFAKAMRGKSKPPKRLIDAVAMESANRAITEQTLNRLKEIATGQLSAAQKEKALSPKPKKATPSTKSQKQTSKKSPPAKKSTNGEDIKKKPASKAGK
ncbi:MAG: trigger factor [Chloroflexota bacterium]